MLDYQKTFLALALKHEVLKFGAFTLKSGRVSPYFFNLGRIASGTGLRELGAAYAAALSALELDFDLLFGPAYKGIPLAAAVAMAFAETQGRDLPFAYNRKEAKDHGEGGTMAGAAVAGRRAMIVDDVLTAGTALREAHRLLTAAGAIPVAAITALDRQETGSADGPGGRSAIAEIRATLGFPVYALVTVRDLLAYLEQQPGFADTATAIRDYQARYGRAEEERRTGHI